MILHQIIIDSHKGVALSREMFEFKALNIQNVRNDEIKSSKLMGYRFKEIHF